MKKNIKNKHNGFGLIEIIVVLAIMGILSSVGLISYQSSRSEAKLRAAQREVATVIRITQSYALQGKIQDMGGLLGKKTPCGYGFEFINANTYRIFYTFKSDPNKACDDPNTENRAYPNPRLLAYGDKSGEPQSFTLPDDVTMTNSSFNETGFYFTIPFGDVYRYQDKDAFIGNTIEFKFGNDTKRISVNGQGDVEELD